MALQIFFPVHLVFVLSRNILITVCLLAIPVCTEHFIGGSQTLLRAHNYKQSLDLLAWFLFPFCVSIKAKPKYPQQAASATAGCCLSPDITKEVRCQCNPCPLQAVDLCGPCLPHTNCAGSSSSSSSLVSYYNVCCKYS